MTMFRSGERGLAGGGWGFGWAEGVNLGFHLDRRQRELRKLFGEVPKRVISASLSDLLLGAAIDISNHPWKLRDR
jgi:hypothetical protein